MSSKFVPIGPGASGLAAGLAWGRIKGAQDTNEALKAELDATRERLMRAVAAGQAQQSVANAMVDELADVEAGRISSAQRRVSDPKNRDARVEHFVKAEEEALNRISGGRLRPQPE